MYKRFNLRTLFVVVTTAAFTVAAFHQHPKQRQRRAIAEVRKIGAVVHFDYEKGPLTIGAPYMKHQAATIAPKWLQAVLGEDSFGNPEFLSIAIVADGGQTKASQLPDLPTLKSLMICDSDMTTTEVMWIARMPHLTTLFLNRSEFPNCLSATISTLTELEVLELNGTAITDNEVAQLSELPNIRQLGLSGTDVSDLSVSNLVKFRNLDSLNIRDTKITEAGLQKLRDSMPQCMIFY